MSTSRRTWVLLCTSALPGVSEGLRDLRVGSDVLVITWLDRMRRDALVVHPRGDARPATGVSTLDLLTGHAGVTHRPGWLCAVMDWAADLWSVT
jgi:hypothetical protein